MPHNDNVSPVEQISWLRHSSIRGFTVFKPGMRAQENVNFELSKTQQNKFKYIFPTISYNMGQLKIGMQLVTRHAL